MASTAEPTSFSPPSPKRPKWGEDTIQSDKSGEDASGRMPPPSNHLEVSCLSGMDSGFSDGATPPASAEEDNSQESFSCHSSEANFPRSFDLGLSNSDLHDGLTDQESGSSSQQDSLSHEAQDAPGSTDDGNDDLLSAISSGKLGAKWTATAGPISWVQQHMLKGTNPRMLLQLMISADSEIPDDLDQLTLWKIILNMVSEPPKRTKLDFVNTLNDVAKLIKSCSRIIVLTGAGVSVSCGIPDFRSRDGIYARLAVDFPDLPDPQAMFDIHYFRRDPRPFFKFAREIYPGQFTPSPCHRFIRNIEKQGKLLRNYTQNIDTLEQVAGINRVIQCHGSFATASCTNCKYKVDAEVIKKDIFEQRIPYCPVCPKPDESKPSEEIPSIIQSAPTPELANAKETQPTPLEQQIGPHPEPQHKPQPAIMKPDIVFFGEDLSDLFHNTVAEDKNEVDLLIMIGSSLKVRPVSMIPSSIPATAPQILINREPLPHITPDVELLGDCDGIINQLCHLLGEGWQDAKHKEFLEECTELLPKEEEDKKHVAPHVSQSDTDEKSTSELSSSNPDEATPSDSNQVSEESGSPEKSIEDGLWVPKKRQSLSKRLPDSKYYFQSPNRYVFPGAEVFTDDDDTDDDSSDSSDDDDEGEEEGEEGPSKSPKPQSPSQGETNGHCSTDTNSTSEQVLESSPTTNIPLQN